MRRESVVEANFDERQNHIQPDPQTALHFLATSIVGERPITAGTSIRNSMTCMRNQSRHVLKDNVLRDNGVTDLLHRSLARRTSGRVGS